MAEANDSQNRLSLSQTSQKVTVIMSIFQERRADRAGVHESNTFIAPACVRRQLCERHDFEGPQARRPEDAWDRPSRVIGRSCPPSAQDKTTQALVRAAHDYHQRGTIVTLLRQLGLRIQGRGQAFWDQPRQELEWLFHDAREQYEHRRISLMPRRLEDERERVTQLNALWREILSRFEWHLSPHFLRASGVIRNRKRLPDGIFSHYCQYRKCRAHFLTPWRHQKYCCKAHKCYEATANWKAKESVYRRFYRSCQYPPCGRSFVTARRNKVYHSARCQQLNGCRLWAQRHTVKARAYARSFYYRNLTLSRERSRASYYRQRQRDPEKFRRRWRAQHARRQFRVRLRAETLPAEICA
jgi:hypothetical protein